MMTTSHGTIQGYNGQALVDAKHQVIVKGEAFGWGQDHHHLEPVVEGAQENMKAIGKEDDYFKDAILTADTAYHNSTESIKKCEEEGIDAYILDKDYRKRHPGLEVKKSYMDSRRKKFSPEDFTYDKAADQYVGPMGKRLKFYTDKAKANGIVYLRYSADAQDCMICRVRQGCINKKGEGGKRKVLMIPIESENRNYSKEMAAKIDTDRGREFYPHRITIVEPVFANIRTQKRLDHFTLRGKIKVNIQWLLYCMVHNIEKIANFGPEFAVV